MPTSSGGGKVCWSECSRSPANRSRCQHILRALERIKDKLQSLSRPSTSAGHAENERDMIIANDLADDLRDAIVEYQVSTDGETQAG